MEKEFYLYGYGIYRESNGTVQVDRITDIEKNIKLYHINKNIILEMIQAICLRDELDLLAIVRVLNLGSFKAFDIDVVQDVNPNDFINELNAKIEKDFGYEVKNQLSVPLGLI